MTEVQSGFYCQLPEPCLLIKPNSRDCFLFRGWAEWRRVYTRPGPGPRVPVCGWGAQWLSSVGGEAEEKRQLECQDDIKVWNNKLHFFKLILFTFS